MLSEDRLRNALEAVKIARDVVIGGAVVSLPNAVMHQAIVATMQFVLEMPEAAEFAERLANMERLAEESKCREAAKWN